MEHQAGTGRHPVFDLLRIAAATMVVVSHSFPLAGAIQPTIVPFAGFPWTLGHCGVMVLFATSGYLVSKSWQRDPHIRRYAIRRVLRIWPGLILVVALTTLVVGPLATTIGKSAYLHADGTWYYLGHNMTMQPINYLLPGVFTTNPTAAVNGSLWSLPYEVVCYLGLMVLGLVRGLRWWILAPLSVFTLFVYKNVIGGTWVEGWTGEWRGFVPVFLVATVPLFLAGALIAQFDRYVIGRHAAAATAVAAFAVGVWRGSPLLLLPSVAFLVIYLGTSAWAPLTSLANKVSRLGDPSYGIYLYSFPIQQVLVSMHHGTINPYVLVVESLTFSVIAGYGSWHLIERHGMRLARKLITFTRARPQPLPAGAA